MTQPCECGLALRRPKRLSGFTERADGAARSPTVSDDQRAVGLPSATADVTVSAVNRLLRERRGGAALRSSRGLSRRAPAPPETASFPDIQGKGPSRQRWEGEGGAGGTTLTPDPLPLARERGRCGVAVRTIGHRGARPASHEGYAAKVSASAACWRSKSVM